MTARRKRENTMLNSRSMWVPKSRGPSLLTLHPARTHPEPCIFPTSCLRSYFSICLPRNLSVLGLLCPFLGPGLKDREGLVCGLGRAGRRPWARIESPPQRPRPPPPDYLSAKSRARPLGRGPSVSASPGSLLAPHTCGPDSRASGLKAKSVPG